MYEAEILATDERGHAVVRHADHKLSVVHIQNRNGEVHLQIEMAEGHQFTLDSKGVYNDPDLILEEDPEEPVSDWDELIVSAVAQVISHPLAKTAGNLLRSVVENYADQSRKGKK